MEEGKENQEVPKFTVKLVSDETPKSIQEREAEVIAKHQEEAQQEEVIIPNVENDIVEEEISEDKVKSFFKLKFGREVESFDELLQDKVVEVEKSVELPEDVEAFYKYKKETGRGLNDFFRLNSSLDDQDEDTLLKNYLIETKPHLDRDDVNFEFNRKFNYDDELDEESEIRAKKIAKKEELSKAKEYFTNAKEKYKAPLESNDSFVPEQERENYNAFKSYKDREADIQLENDQKGKYFTDKTNELFSQNFEGFKFKISDNNEIAYKPEDVTSLKEKQSNLKGFFDKFLDDKGYLKDAEMFHKAIAVANNPESFAKFFYEKGQSDATTNITKESKNLDMVRTSPNIAPSIPGFKVRKIDDGNSGTIKIRKL